MTGDDGKASESRKGFTCAETHHGQDEARELGDSGRAEARDEPERAPRVQDFGPDPESNGESWRTCKQGAGCAECSQISLLLPSQVNEPARHGHHVWQLGSGGNSEPLQGVQIEAEASPAG